MGTVPTCGLETQLFTQVVYMCDILLNECICMTELREVDVYLFIMAHICVQTAFCMCVVKG